MGQPTIILYILVEIEMLLDPPNVLRFNEENTEKFLLFRTLTLDALTLEVLIVYGCTKTGLFM